MNAFNPELIVLGGIYHALFPYVRQSVIEGAAQVRLEAPAEMVEVIRSGLGAGRAADRRRRAGAVGRGERPDEHRRTAPS